MPSQMFFTVTYPQASTVLTRESSKDVSGYLFESWIFRILSSLDYQHSCIVLTLTLLHLPILTMRTLMKPLSFLHPSPYTNIPAHHITHTVIGVGDCVLRYLNACSALASRSRLTMMTSCDILTNLPRKIMHFHHGT
jgi:hypothetical protein